MHFKRPSASLVVSVLALIVASSGTAIAAGHYLITSSKQIKPGAIALRNISRSARSALHGAHGPRGVQGLQGLQGSSGLQGPAGSPGAALGWAVIARNGPNLVEAGQGITNNNVTFSSAGNLCCFHDLPFSPRTALVSPSALADNNAIVEASTSVESSISGCPSNTVAWAATFIGAVSAHEPFHIWFN